MLNPPDKIISIDWKSAGRDYLAFFQDAYPKLKFLRSREFEMLMDKLALEMPEFVFETFANFLSEFSYQLWHIDTGDDNYNLFLVPEKRAKPRKEEVLQSYHDWMSQEYEEYDPLDDPVGLVHFAPVATTIETAENSASLAKKPNKSKKAAPNIVAESEYPYGYMSLSAHNGPLIVLRFLEDDQSVTETLVNLSVWPFEDVPAGGFLGSEAPLARRLEYGTPNVQYWKPDRGAHKGQLCVITDYQKPTVLPVGEIPIFGLNQFGSVGLADSFFFYHLPPATNRQGFDADLFQKAKDTHLPGLYRAMNTQLDFIVPINQVPRNLIALSASTLIAFWGETHCAKSFAMIDIERKTISDVITLTAELEGEPFALNANEFCYFSTQDVPHPTCPNLKPTLAYLNRYNVVTGQTKRAPMDELISQQTVNMAILRNQAPDKHVLVSFGGGAHVIKGHGDWFIINYLNTMPGPNVLALFWNSQTDELVKILPKDFPREPPMFWYNNGLDRYHADGYDKIDLLIPFDDIYATRPHGKLTWEPVE